MIDKARLQSLIPHAGAMCLLDSVEEWTAEWIRCSSFTHRDPANPLRLRDALAALHLTEYGAQAMAVHGALLANGGPQPGMLGVLRDIRLYTDRLDDLPNALTIVATRRLARGDGFIYEFVARTWISTQERVLCEGRITVALQAIDRSTALGREP